MNVIVLGLGSIGLGNRNIRSFRSYVNFFLKSKKYKLYAVVDPNPKKLRLYNTNFKKKKCFKFKKFKRFKKRTSKKNRPCLLCITYKIFYSYLQTA